MKKSSILLGLVFAFVSADSAFAAYCRDNKDCAPDQYCYLNTCRQYGGGPPYSIPSSVTYRCQGTGTVEASVGSGPYLPTQKGFDVRLSPGQSQTLVIGKFTGGSFTAYFHRRFEVDPEERGRMRVKEYDRKGILSASYVREDGFARFSTSWGELSCDILVD